MKEVLEGLIEEIECEMEHQRQFGDLQNSCAKELEQELKDVQNRLAELKK